MTTREQIVNQAKSWLGRKESDGSFRVIIDTYNADRPLPRGYAVSYNDAWCATFVSAVAVKCNATDIIPKECSCRLMIQHFKSLGSWMETDSYLPAPGDIIFYDWNDSGSGENTGNPEHVGIVEKVSNSVITVIEGNYSDSVARREIAVNGRYIRGYGVPKYAMPKPQPTTTKVIIELDELQQGSKGEQVKTLQRLLVALGFSVGSAGIDGDFGPATYKAVIAFQKARSLDADGIVGIQTWSKLLGV